MIFKTCENYNATVKILINKENFALALEISILKRTSVSLLYRYQLTKVLKYFIYSLSIDQQHYFLEFNGTDLTGLDMV